MKPLLSVSVLLALLISCNANPSKKENEMSENFITEAQSNKVISTMQDSLGEPVCFRIERGVQQVAALWRESDGTAAEFADFCKTSFVSDEAQLDKLFNTLERNFEVFDGYFHKIDVLLKEPLQLEGEEITPVDMMFGSYDVTSHLNDDLYANKIAFLAALNFPFYSLQEKTVYLRFFYKMNNFSHEVIQEHWANVDYRKNLSLIGLVLRGGHKEIIAIGSYAETKAKEIAEVAFVVREDYQNMGIASYLMEQLERIARKNNYKAFEATVLKENHAMLRAFKKRYPGLQVKKDNRTELTLLMKFTP